MLFKKALMFQVIFTLLFLLSSSHFVLAEEKPDNSLKAVTTDNPLIALEELEIILIPLTREQLFAEAEGWQLLLKDASVKVAIAQLAVKKVNTKISDEEEVEKKQSKTPEKISPEEKEKLADELKKEIKSELTGDTTALQDKVDADLKDEMKADLKKAQQQKKEDNDVNNESESRVDVIEEQKEDVLAVLRKARKEQRQMVDRLDAVLEAINDKIGLDEHGKELKEVQPYRRYIDAVGGIKLDVADTKSSLLSIKGYLLSEDGGLKWIINTITFIAILFAFWVLSKILSNAVRKALKFSQSKSQILNSFFINTIRRLTIIVGILLALSAIGISVAPIMAVIGAAGFVVAFALQSTLSNFASGIMIMFYRPFDVGDLVEVAGIMGQVKSMTLVSTTIMTPDNKLMIVPNNSIWNDVITNAHYSRERRVDMVFGIGYDDDIEQATQLMKQVLADHPLVLDTPESTVQVSELADSSVNFVCRPWVKTPDYWTVYWDITRTVKEQFDEAGISIPFPQRDIHIHQTSQALKEPSSSPKNLPQNHEKPVNDQFNEMDTEQDDD